MFYCAWRYIPRPTCIDTVTATIIKLVRKYEVGCDSTYEKCADNLHKYVTFYLRRETFLAAHRALHAMVIVMSTTATVERSYLEGE
jgi:hypothetical protein